MIRTEPLFQSLIETTTPSSLMYLPIRDITAQVKDLTVCLIHSVPLYVLDTIVHIR